MAFLPPPHPSPSRYLLVLSYFVSRFSIRCRGSCKSFHRDSVKVGLTFVHVQGVFQAADPLKGAAFNMASEAKPPLLAAPLEVRFEIYRHAWTIPYTDGERLFQHAVKQWSGQIHPYQEAYYFMLQVEQLHSLVSICQQIRNEVLSEYFYQTQVGIANWREHNSMLKEVQPYDVQHIQSSLLFASYTQHVCLRWTTGEPDLMSRTLDWLLQLKQLKALELIIDWPPRRRMEPILKDIFDSSLFQRLTTLRNLEKLVVLIDGDCWEETPQVQRIKDILSKSVREDLRQVCCSPVRRVPRFFSHSLEDKQKLTDNIMR